MKSFVIYFTILMACVQVAFAGERSPFNSFKSISMEEGLSSNKISRIVRDSLGTLWVGTYHGLNRIAENEIIRYDRDPFYGKEIWFMFVDRDSGLWVSVEGDLYKYDYSSDTFFHVTVNGTSVSADSYDLASDGILFCTNMGIIRWDYSSQTAGIVLEKYGERFKNIKMLDPDTAVATIDYKGVYKLNLNSGQSGLLYGIDASDFVTASLMDSHGHLWIALYGKGLFCLDPENGELLCSRPSMGIILDIKEYDGELWIGTDGNGICLIDLDTMEPKGFSAARDMQYELRTVSCIYREGKNLWIGTIRHGLQCLSRNAVRHISSANIINSDPNKDFSVQCFCESDDGTVFVGTDGSGLYAMDSGAEDIRLLPDFMDSKIVSIEFAGKDKLLVSVYEDGIYLYDVRTRDAERILINDEETDRDIFSKDCIVNICRGYDDRILVFTDEIFCYDYGSRRICRYNMPGLDGNVNNLRLFRSDKGTMMLVSNHDVYRINADMSAARLYHTDDFLIYSAAMTDNLLFVSDGYNLYRINSDMHTEGLIAEIGRERIYMMAADGSGDLWIIRYDNFLRISLSGQDEFLLLDHSDGVMPNDYFYPTTVMRSRSGELYLGGNSGFNIINLSEIDCRTPSDNISFLSVTVDEKSCAYRNENNLYRINVPHNYGFIEIRTVESGEMNVFKEHVFKYEIKKNDRRGKVVKTLYGKTIRIPLLDPGKYMVDIYVKREPGIWRPVHQHIMLVVNRSAAQRILQLSVIWLIVLCVVTLVLLIYFRKEKRKSEQIYMQRKKELAENKINFFINMSHELRTPLTLIYAPLKRIIEQESLPEGYRDDLKPVYHQSLQMIRIINMILDSRKFEEGYSKMIIMPVGFNEWARSIAEDFKIEYEAKGIEIHYEFDDNIGDVNMDEGKCSIALSNFMMNAYKYSPSGTVVTVRTALEGDFVRLSVADQGIGISGADAKSLFKRFKRNTTSANGFGLGLAYTRQVIEAHGGDVGAEQNQGKGSTFYFRIPCGLVCDMAGRECDNMLAGAQDSGNMEFDISRCTALIADDDPELLDFMETSLKDSFGKIITAADGADAYEKAAGCMPDVIISDVMMPEMNGYELCRKIKNNIDISHIPVILLTAQTNMSHRTAGYKSGADLFIPKPFDISGLLAAVKTTLANREIIRNRYKTDFESVSANTASFSEADEKFLTKMEEYIMENIADEQLDAQAIIDYMCMSRSKFYKKMKELTGIGVKEYVNNLRMKRAAELLRNKEKQIAEIAMEVGFYDNLYFSKVFKAHYSMSPSAYRKTLGS